MHAAQPGPLALVGSGEFLPAMAEVDAHLLDGRAPKVAVLPTAAGREGSARVRYWLDLAQDHYGRLGVEVVEVPVLERADANDDAWAAAIAGCGLVYLSGGDPHHLTETLRATVVWAAIEAAWRDGAALAGCSAGAMALASRVAPLRSRRPRDGFGLVPEACVLPHFDRFIVRAPELVDLALGLGGPVLGIDEDTALVGAPGAWRVWGRSEVRIFRTGATPTVHRAGDLLADL